MKYLNKKRFSMKQVAFLMSLVIVGVAVFAYASSLNVTNTFTSGTTISSSQMNTNFLDVETAVNDNDSRITALETAGGLWTPSGFDIYYDAGNVGIGTTTPTEQLEVNGKVQVNGDDVQIGANGLPRTYHLTTQITGTGNWGLSFISENSGVEEAAIDRLGNALFTGNVTVTGSLTKGSGTFVQPHRNDPSKEIQYAFFEGPEHAIFLRGSAELKDGKSVIDLPEYFSMVASEEEVQVQVTPYSTDTYGLAVVERTRNRIVVKELKNGNGNFKFDYFITALRDGFQEFKPIVANTHFKPSKNETAKDFENRYSSDDLTMKAMKMLLVSNGILTKDGKLNISKMKELGWKVAEEGTPQYKNIRSENILP